MLYLYDNAIVDDLRSSFNSENTVVSVISPDLVHTVAAQLLDDKIKLPIVSVYRDPDTSIDESRMNFTRGHFGVSACFDPSTNLIYDEKVLPINLTYHLTILCANSIDQDEIIRELIFKYYNEYFLTIKLPYECDRKIRFGVRLDLSNIERKSGVFESLSEGQLYQSVIPMICEGCVLVSYTPRKLPRFEMSRDIELDNPNSSKE